MSRKRRPTPQKVPPAPPCNAPAWAWANNPLVAGGLIVLCGLAAYANIFAVPFLFDGEVLLGQLPGRRLWPPWAPLLGTNRPIGIWTFAINYALHGSSVWGYHAVNLAIHLAAGLVLYGVVQRTFSRGALAKDYGRAAGGIALVVALIWTVHPLQTQSVTYIYQRFESQMGLFFLLSLYSLIRADDSPRRLAWYTVSVLSCLLAIGTKEVAAACPLVLLWYDWALLSPTWRELWRRRWAFHSLLLAFLAAGVVYVATHQTMYAKGGVLGFGTISAVEYALSQPGVIAHYLRLSLWPAGQCVDYAWPVARSAGTIVLPGLLVAGLLGGTVWCMFRHKELSFLGGWFFLILAPTSSVLPVVDLAFEHRMYLPSAAVVVAVVLGVRHGLTVLGRDGTIHPARLGMVLVGAAVLALVVATHTRNLVYRDAIAFWTDVVRKAPLNTRAHRALTPLLIEAGRAREAWATAESIANRHPQSADAQVILGEVLLRLNRPSGALAPLRRAVELQPDHAEGRLSLGLALEQLGGIEDAVVHFEAACRLSPLMVKPHLGLARALLALGKVPEAAAAYQDALSIAPGDADAQSGFSLALGLTGQHDEAVARMRRVVQAHPEGLTYRENLAFLLLESGQPEAARAEVGELLRRAPRRVEARILHARVLAALARRDEALAELRLAERLAPGRPDVQAELTELLSAP